MRIMAWKISWSSEATRFLSKMEKTDARRLVKKIEDAAEDPRRYFSQLAGQDDYKLRVGDHRILVLLLHAETTIFIEKIGHRKNIYKKQ